MNIFIRQFKKPHFVITSIALFTLCGCSQCFINRAVQSKAPGLPMPVCATQNQLMTNLLEPDSQRIYWQNNGVLCN